MLQVLLNKGLQALKKTPEDCDKKFFTATNFHRFHVQLIKHFLTQLSDQVDSVSLIITLILHLLNQNCSLDTFHHQNNTDAEKLIEEGMKVFTQTEFDTSSETEVSPKRNI